MNLIQVGIASPNPEYEQTIVNLSGNINEKVQNKNFLNVNNPFTVTLYRDINCDVPAGSYKMSCSKVETTGTTDYLIDTVYEDNTHRYDSLSRTTLTVTIPAAKRITRFRVYSQNSYQAGTGVTTTFYDLMLRKRESSENYQEHAEQNITFPLEEGQYLAEEDYLADDGIHHVRTKIVLDGTETIIEHNTQNNIKSFRITIADLLLANSELLSNMFINMTWSGFNSSNRDFYRVSAYRDSTHYLYFSQPNENITSLDDFKAFLAQKYANGTPVEVEYQLENEVIEPYTEAQQTAWNEIKELYTYNEVTNIDGNANLKIKYWERIER